MSWLLLSVDEYALSSKSVEIGFGLQDMLQLRPEALQAMINLQKHFAQGTAETPERSAEPSVMGFKR